jgi:hypothetical protein
MGTKSFGCRQVRTGMSRAGWTDGADPQDWQAKLGKASEFLK